MFYKLLKKVFLFHLACVVFKYPLTNTEYYIIKTILLQLNTILQQMTEPCLLCWLNITVFLNFVFYFTWLLFLFLKLCFLESDDHFVIQHNVWFVLCWLIFCINEFITAEYKQFIFTSFVLLCYVSYFSL